MTTEDVQPEPVQPEPVQPEPMQPEQQVQQETPNAYQTIIEQQNAQIAALMEHTASLNNQIAQMVQNGAQFTQPRQAQQVGQNWAVQPPSLADDADYSLQALAKEIGKK